MYATYILQVVPRRLQAAELVTVHWQHGRNGLYLLLLPEPDKLQHQHILVSLQVLNFLL